MVIMFTYTGDGEISKMQEQSGKLIIFFVRMIL
jgi:hypothetical protein